MKSSSLSFGFLLAALPGMTTPSLADRPDAKPPEIGRLFLTPEMRLALERQRPAGAIPPRPGENLRLEGVVVRSSGASTVWLHPPALPSSGVEWVLKTSRRHPDTVRLASGKAPSVDLKVGDSFNPLTGKRDNALKGGEIRIHPAPQP